MASAESEPVLIETEVVSSVPGCRVFLVERAPSAAGQPGPPVRDEGECYYKHFPGLVTPFGLPLECFPKYEAILNANPALVPAVNLMMQGAIAPSTARQYKPVILDFQEFCRKHR